VLSVDGEIIKAYSPPHFNEFHKTWHVAGFRWIKSQRKWSGNCLIHLLGSSVQPTSDPTEVLIEERNAAIAKARAALSKSGG
jgi:hypothetical protein